MTNVYIMVDCSNTGGFPMGIDVYATGIYEATRAKYQPIFEALVKARDAEKSPVKREELQEKVSEAFDRLHGDGYLRESYHGGPYVTRYLVAEGWDEDKHDYEAGGVPIPAKVLRERLPVAVLLAIYRRHVVYGEGNPGDIIIEGKDGTDAFLNAMKGIFAPGGAIDQANKGTEAEE